jgi:hypothetical protein
MCRVYGRGSTNTHHYAVTIRKAQADVAARAEFHGTVVFVPTHDLGVPKEESPGPWEPHHEFRSAETYYLVWNQVRPLSLLPWTNRSSRSLRNPSSPSMA